MPPGEHLAAKTHCPQGHPYDGRNLTITKRGWRRCKACSRDEAQQRREADPSLKEKQQEYDRIRYNARRRGEYFVKKYGITLEARDKLIMNQKGCCDDPEKVQKALDYLIPVGRRYP
jgi:hypothetical protein